MKSPYQSMESSNRVCLHSYTFRCLFCMEGDAPLSLASKSRAVQEDGWAGDFVSKIFVQTHNLAFDSTVNNPSRHWTSASLALTKNVHKEKKELYNLAVMHFCALFPLRLLWLFGVQRYSSLYDSPNCFQNTTEPGSKSQPLLCSVVKPPWDSELEMS